MNQPVIVVYDTDGWAWHNDSIVVALVALGLVTDDR